MRTSGILEAMKIRFKRWDSHTLLTKRQQFVLVTATLTLGLVLTQLVSVDSRYPLVITLSVVAYILSAFSLREDLAGIEWFTLLILPTLFTMGVSLFYFLLPVRWLTRVPAACLYAIGMYALLLTENIFNVAADRNIALLRAARSIGFLLTLVTYFFLIQTILAFRLSVIGHIVAVGITSFILVFQSLWSVVLEPQVSPRIKNMSVAIAVMLTQLAWIFTFWPVKATLVALFLTTCLYSSVGMAQEYLEEKLYKKTAIEFFLVNAVVFAIVVLSAKWRGNLF